MNGFFSSHHTFWIDGKGEGLLNMEGEGWNENERLQRAVEIGGMGWNGQRRYVQKARISSGVYGSESSQMVKCYVDYR